MCVICTFTDCGAVSFPLLLHWQGTQLIQFSLLCVRDNLALRVHNSCRKEQHYMCRTWEAQRQHMTDQDTKSPALCAQQLYKCLKGALEALVLTSQK